MPLNLPPFMVPPPCLELKESQVASESQGIFCKEPVGVDTQFGPYIGEIITRDALDKRRNEIDFRYAWHVNDEKSSRVSHVINATVPEKGNWMRYVNSARFFEEQNIVSVQEGSEIYYKALKDIKPGEELLTWFGPDKNKTRKRKRNSRASSASSVDTRPSSGRSSPAVTDTEAAGNVGKRLRKKKVSEDMLSLDDHDVIFASSGLHHNRIRNNSNSRMRRSTSLNSGRTMATRRGDLHSSHTPQPSPQASHKASPSPQQTVSIAQPASMLKMSDIRPTAGAAEFSRPLSPASRAMKRPKSIHQIVDALKTAKSGINTLLGENDFDESEVELVSVVNGPSPSPGGGKHGKRSSLVGTAEYMEENLVTNHQFLFEVTTVHKAVPKDAPKRIKYACDICEGQYRKPVNLKRHYLREHINQKYLCEEDVQFLSHKTATSSDKVDADIDPDADDNDNDTSDGALRSMSFGMEGFSDNCENIQIKQEPSESDVNSKEEPAPMQSIDTNTREQVHDAGVVSMPVQNIVNTDIADNETTPVPNIRDTGVPVPDVRDTSTPVPNVDDTRTSVPIVDDISKSVLSVRDSSTSVPSADDTRTSVPIVDDSSKSVQNVGDTNLSVMSVDDTGISVPIVDDSSKSVQSVADTNTPAPSVDSTTTSVPSAHDTSTLVPGVDSTGKPVPSVDEKNAPLASVDPSSTPASIVDDTSSPVPSLDDKDAPLQNVEDSGTLVQSVDNVSTPVPSVDDTSSPEQSVDDVSAPVQSVDNRSTLVQTVEETSSGVMEPGEEVKPKVKRAEMEKNLKSKPVEGKKTFSYSGTEGVHDAFRCHLCVQLFPSVEKLKYHLTQDSHRSKGDKQFACDRCNLRFRFRHNYQRHMDSHGPDLNELSTACHICGKKFLNEANMRKHLRFHSGRNFPCKYGCDVVYPNVAELVKHLRAFHPDLPKRSQLSSTSNVEADKKTVARRPKSADEVSPSTSQTSLTVQVVKTEEEAIKEHEALHPPGWLEPRGRKMRPGIVGVQCTICKKRFSTYNSMCRHRRSVHRVLKQGGGFRPASSTSNSPTPFLAEADAASFTDLVSSRNIHIEASVEEMYRAIEMEEARNEMDRDMLVFSPPPSPISFYENVADNIAENLSCYLDGGSEALKTAHQRIKVDDYVPLAEAHGIESESTDIDWSSYNFPPFFMPVDPVIPNPPSPPLKLSGHKDALLSREGISPAYTTRSAIAELEATRRLSLCGMKDSQVPVDRERVPRRGSVGALDQKLKNSDKLVRRASVGSFENQKDVTESQKESTEKQKDITENLTELTDVKKEIADKEKESKESQGNLTTDIKSNESAENVVDDNVGESVNEPNNPEGTRDHVEKSISSADMSLSSTKDVLTCSKVEGRIVQLCMDHGQEEPGQGSNSMEKMGSVDENADEAIDCQSNALKLEDSVCVADMNSISEINSMELREKEDIRTVSAIGVEKDNGDTGLEKQLSGEDELQDGPSNDKVCHLSSALPAGPQTVSGGEEASHHVAETACEADTKELHLCNQIPGESLQERETMISNSEDKEAEPCESGKDGEDMMDCGNNTIVEQHDQSISKPISPPDSFLLPSESETVAQTLNVVPEKTSEAKNPSNISLEKGSEGQNLASNAGPEPESQLSCRDLETSTNNSLALSKPEETANDCKGSFERESDLDMVECSGIVANGLGEFQESRTINGKELSNKESPASGQLCAEEEPMECCQEQGTGGNNRNDSEFNVSNNIDQNLDLVGSASDAHQSGKKKEQNEDEIPDTPVNGNEQTEDTVPPSDQNEVDQNGDKLCDTKEDVKDKENREDKQPTSKSEHIVPAMMNKSTDSSASRIGSDKGSHDLSEKELEYLSKGMVYYVRLSKKRCPHVVGKTDTAVCASEPDTDNTLLRALELAEKKQKDTKSSLISGENEGGKASIVSEQNECAADGSVTDTVHSALLSDLQKDSSHRNQNGIPDTGVIADAVQCHQDEKKFQIKTGSPQESSTNTASTKSDDLTSEHQASSLSSNMISNIPQEPMENLSAAASGSGHMEQDNSDDDLDMEIMRLKAKIDIQALQEKVAIDRGEEEEMCEGCRHQSTEHGEPCRRTADDFAKMRFGRKHPVYVVCSMCRRYYHGVESLLRHQLKKHPSIQCSYFEVENGHGLEMLFYPEPSTRGVLAESVLLPPQHVNQESYTCTRCKLNVKQYSRLRAHIINCDPNTPTTPHTRKKRHRANRHRFMEKMLPDPVNKETKSKEVSSAVRDLSFRPKGNGGLASGNKSRTASASSSPQKSSTVSTRSAATSTIQTGTRSSTHSRTKSQNWRFSPSQYVSSTTKMNSGDQVSGRTRRRRNYELLYNPAAHVRRRERTECVDIHQCQGCRLSFRTLSLLERHTKNCADKDKIINQKPIADRLSEGVGVKKHSCHYCPKRFKYLKGVYNHYNNNFCRVRAQRLAGDGLSAEDHAHEAHLQALLKQQAWNKMENRDHTDVIQGRAQLLDDGTIAHTKRKGGWPKGLKRSNKRRRNGWTYIKRRKLDGSGSSSETSSSPSKSRSATSVSSVGSSVDSATSVAMSELEARLREPITPSAKVKKMRSSSAKETYESGNAPGSQGAERVYSEQSKYGTSRNKRSHKSLDDLSQAPIIDRMDTVPPMKTRDGKQMSPDLEPPTLSPIPPPDQSGDQTQMPTSQNKKKRKRKVVRADGPQSKKCSSGSSAQTRPQVRSQVSGVSAAAVSPQPLLASQVRVGEGVTAPVLAWEHVADLAGTKGGYKLVTLKIPTVVPRIPNQVQGLISPTKETEQGSAGSGHLPEPVPDQKPLPPNFLFPSPTDLSKPEQGKEERIMSGGKNKSKVSSTPPGESESCDSASPVDESPPVKGSEGRQRKKAVDPQAGTTIKDLFKNRKSPTRSRSNQKNTLKSMDVYRYEKNPFASSSSTVPVATPIPVTATTVAGKSPPVSVAPLISGSGITMLPPGAMLAVLPNAPIMLQPTSSSVALTSPSTTSAKSSINISPALQSAVADGKVLLLDPRSLTSLLAPGSVPITTQPVVTVSPSSAPSLSKNASPKPQVTTVSSSASNKLTGKESKVKQGMRQLPRPTVDIPNFLFDEVETQKTSAVVNVKDNTMKKEVVKSKINTETDSPLEEKAPSKTSGKSKTKKKPKRGPPPSGASPNGSKVKSMVMMTSPGVHTMVSLNVSPSASPVLEAAKDEAKDTAVKVDTPNVLSDADSTDKSLSNSRVSPARAVKKNKCPVPETKERKYLEKGDQKDGSVKGDKSSEKKSVLLNVPVVERRGEAPVASPGTDTAANVSDEDLPLSAVAARAKGK